jgi:hypothetical protein
LQIVETAARRSAGTAPPAPMRQGINERMVDYMEFMEKLQKQKDDARAAYVKARNEWADTRTAENIKGDFEKWKILCNKKADCMRLGVII